MVTMRMNLDEIATRAAIDVRNGLGDEINVGVVTNLLIRLGAALFKGDETEVDTLGAELLALRGDLALAYQHEEGQSGPERDQVDG
jgi:hypothetical protein